MTDEEPKVWVVPPGFSLAEQHHVRTLDSIHPAIRAKKRAKRAGIEGGHKKRTSRYWENEGA